MINGMAAGLTASPDLVARYLRPQPRGSTDRFTRLAVSGAGPAACGQASEVREGVAAEASQGPATDRAGACSYSGLGGAGCTSTVRYRRVMMLLASVGGYRLPVAQMVAASQDAVRHVIHELNATGLPGPTRSCRSGGQHLPGQARAVLHALVDPHAHRLPAPWARSGDPPRPRRLSDHTFAFDEPGALGIRATGGNCCPGRAARSASGDLPRTYGVNYSRLLLDRR